MAYLEGEEYLEDWSSEEILQWAWREHGKQAAIGTSFQGAGLVMIHLSRKLGLDIPVFTLDTGLLFPETLELKARLEQFFGIEIESLVPDYSVEEQAKHFGDKLWERTPDMCCSLRKVVPLQSKLRSIECWITGLRREQSELRANVGIREDYEVEPERYIVKLNPMAKWTRDAIWQYLKDNKIPYNALHDQGYRSIGCWPCTHKVSDESGERAGRWTGFNKTECGIHTFLKRK